jgi:hypothetical protein
MLDYAQIFPYQTDLSFIGQIVKRDKYVGLMDT